MSIDSVLQSNNRFKPGFLPGSGKGLDGTTVTIGGYGKRFQWRNYKDGNNEIITGDFESPTKYSSCMTTEEGPVDTRFQYCDAKWVEFIIVTNLNNINLNISRSITPSYSFSFQVGIQGKWQNTWMSKGESCFQTF